MADQRRRTRAGGAVVALIALLAVGTLLTVMATYREPAAPNPNSAVIATVPPLTGGDVSSPGTGGRPADPGTLGSGAADESAEPWPTPPADPTSAVDQAVAAAADQGVRLAVAVVDRATGQPLISRNADAPYPSLSLLKVMIAADVLTNGWPVAQPPPPDTPEPGGIAGVGDSLLPALTDPSEIAAVLTRMIATSDDELAGGLYDAAGGDELVERVANRYGLTATTPTPDGIYWGNVQITATDMATLLAAVLADPATADVIGPAMRTTTAIAADGVDQRFGLRLVPGAGSKQGWGCCLSGVAGIHSMGFTDDRIVVVLSGAEPDDESLGEQDGLALQADPGARASFAAVDDVVRAALGGPAG